MKWIVLIILLIIGPYTFLRWHYRKPQNAFEPYHDIKDRANTMRLLSAGFQRLTLAADRPAEPLRNIPAIATDSIAGGLPSSLANTLVEKPLLATSILSATTPGESNTLLAYTIEFTCAVSDHRQELSNVHLYLRDGEIFLVHPDQSKQAGSTRTSCRRARESLRVIRHNEKPPAAAEGFRTHAL